MANLNEQIAVSVKQFNTDKTDKNGMAPVLLYVVAGKCPNKNIISGTVAEREGFELGKSYLVQVVEKDEDAVHGRQFSFTKIGELSTIDMIGIDAKLGAPQLVNVTDGSDESEATAEVEATAESTTKL